MKPRYEKVPYTDGASFACAVYRGKDCSNPYHTHPEYELACFTKGRGHWIVGDSMGELRPGFFVLLGPGLPHRYRLDSHPSPATATAEVIQFREDCLGPGFFNLPETRRIRELLDCSRRGLLFDRAFTARTGDNLARLLRLPPADRLLPFLHLLEDAASNAKFRCLASVSYQTSLRPEEAARIDRVVDYIGGHLHGEIYLAEAATLVGLSESSFSRFFRRTVKKSFSRFVNEMRISHACHRLVETDDTITETAFKCGFNNLSNFNRRFLEMRGETPTRFRERFRDNLQEEPDRPESRRFSTSPGTAK